MSSLTAIEQRPHLVSSNLAGLTSGQAAELLAKFGPNDPAPRSKHSIAA